MPSLRGNFLSLDASTELCSVTLALDGRFFSRQCDIPKSHAKVILPLIQELLDEQSVTLADLNKIVVSRGPGSFTGIRICLSMAQGLAYGCGLPIESVDSLSCLAKYAVLQKKLSSGLLVSALDARMNEVYWAAYQVKDGSIEKIQPPVLSTPADFSSQLGELVQSSELKALSNFYGVGHGWNLLPVEQHEMFCAASQVSEIDPLILPHALGAAHLVCEERWGEVSIDGAIEPLYIRNEVAWEKRKRIRTENPFKN